MIPSQPIFGPTSNYCMLSEDAANIDLNVFCFTQSEGPGWLNELGSWNPRRIGDRLVCVVR
jgi:hypothetical protein